MAYTFIPDKLKVGFDERANTYTGKLAYVTYVNLKGETAKEKSWEGWRDKNIPVECFDNVATEGFVLNKKVGGYKSGWNHRQTYVRCYDPRGFEFEITIANLLFILENTNSIKGKGLEGSFVYGWDGADLMLLPVDTQEYKESVDYTNTLKENKTFKAKDLVVGKTYFTRSYPKGLIYLGKHDEYGYNNAKKGKAFFFAVNLGFDTKSPFYTPKFSIETKKSIGKMIISESADISPFLEQALEYLHRNPKFSPVDDTKTSFIPYTKEEFLKDVESRNYFVIYTSDSKYILDKLKDGTVRATKDAVRYRTVGFEGDVDNLFDALKPSYKVEYLENGQIYKTSLDRSTYW